MMGGVVELQHDVVWSVVVEHMPEKFGKTFEVVTDCIFVDVV